MDIKNSEYKYDVALSFAGENRDYVEKIAKCLTQEGIKVFYDKFETVNLWGKDLYQYLSDIYKNKAKYCIIFVSKQYKEKAWTKHELRNAQNRAFLENREYILPIFIDDVKLDGLNDTVGYVHVANFSQQEIVNLIISKLGKSINPFIKCTNIKDLLDMAIKKIYHISKTDYNQIILNSIISSHSLGLAVVADIISKGKQRYRIVSVNGVITSSYGEQKTISVSDALKEKKYMCAVAETLSELVVPIRVTDTVVGVINIESNKKDYFNSELINQIERISVHIGYMLSILDFKLQSIEELPYITYTPNELCN